MIARIIQIILKLTSARKKSERISVQVKRNFINLLTPSISYVRSDRIAPTPKKIPTLFQLPITVEVTSPNRPNERTFAPKIMRMITNKATRMAERTNTK